MFFNQFSIGTRAIVRSLTTYTSVFFIRNDEICYQNFSVCVIAVSKSQEFLLKVRRLFIYFLTPPPSHRCIVFFDDDTRHSTSTRSQCFFDDVVHYI